jgi:hypothetical protein
LRTWRELIQLLRITNEDFGAACLDSFCHNLQTLLVECLYGYWLDKLTSGPQ